MTPYPYSNRPPWTLDSAYLDYPEETQPGAALPRYAANVSQAGDTMTNAGGATMNPYLAAGGLGLKALGTGMEIYGAFKGQQTADKNAALAEDAYIADRLRAAREERDREREERLLRAYKLSEAASGAAGRDIASMTQYNRAIGR